jgi:hypothetical protein
VQDRFGGALLERFGGIMFQQQNGVMSDVGPEGRIDLAEDLRDLRLTGLSVVRRP